MPELGREVIVFDGGMGSELERLGLRGVPEELNVTAAEQIRSIHRAYACADVITTNTFGLNRVKYRGAYPIRELALRAIENARCAGKKVFFDIGPTGAMMEPLGPLSFDQAYEAFEELARIAGGEADGFIVETFSDLYEIKACLLALKENADKPIYATMTFDQSGRTLTGSSPEIVACTLSGLGADALGVNCSLGPKELLPVVERLLRVSDKPVIVQPNRGLPVLEGDKTVYKLSAEEFEAYAETMLKMGVSVIGGCCGTTPEFIRRLSRFSGQPVRRPEVRAQTQVCSATVLTEIEGVKVCGERLNPTGKKRLKQALLDGDYDYLADEALKQQNAGADLLDLNVGLPQLDEPRVMREAVKRVQEYSDLPIQIDSSDPAAIESGVRYCNGIPLINSVNGEEEVMARVFPIARKYGAVVLGLAMDKDGVPRTAKGRCEIARRIIERAAEYGIPKHRIMIDTLVVTASAEQALVRETLEALRLVRALGVKTALGVSNVSFGLPNRALLNRTFLAMAMTCGLNMPILNPLDGEMMGAVKAHAVLSGEDENAEGYIEAYKDFLPGAVSAPPGTKRTQEKSAATLYDCVKQGLKNHAAELCEAELMEKDPLTVVNDVLIRALQEVGDLYEKGRLFLPQLVSAAEAAKAAFAVVSSRLPKDAPSKGKVVLATVRGDVHDIGKNIVKVVLESYGYRVIDLGKDVPAEKVVEAWREHRPVSVGLSALMTTTVKGMEETIRALREAGCDAAICVGGAVLNAETARRIGADHYTRDALEYARLLDTLFPSA